MKSIINKVKAFTENKGFVKSALVFAVLAVAFSAALYSPIVKVSVRSAHADDWSDGSSGSDYYGGSDSSGSGDYYNGSDSSGDYYNGTDSCGSSCDSSGYYQGSDSYDCGSCSYDNGSSYYDSYDCGCETGSSYYPSYTSYPSYTCSTCNYNTPVSTPPKVTNTTVVNNNTNNNKNINNNNNNITINTPVTTTVQTPVQTPVVYTPPPVYYPPTQQTIPLSVTCSANPTNPYIGSTVVWSAYASGGSNNGSYGNYSYSWTGSNGLYGNGNTISQAYGNPGTQTATVTVYSNGQTASQTCSVNVQGQQYVQSYTQPNVSVTQIPTTTGTPSAGVFLSQIPATGISSNLKTTLFLLGITLWSAFMAYMIIAKKKLKLATSSVGSVGSNASENDGEVSLSEQVRMFKETNKASKLNS